MAALLITLCSPFLGHVLRLVGHALREVTILAPIDLINSTQKSLRVLSIPRKHLLESDQAASLQDQIRSLGQDRVDEVSPWASLKLSVEATRCSAPKLG